MPRFLRIETDTVTNAIEADSAFVASLDGEWIEADALDPEPGVGWTRAGDPAVWSGPTPPAAPIPSREEMKARLDSRFERKSASLMQSQLGPVKALVFERRNAEAEARQAVTSGGGTPVETDYPALQALVGTSYGSDMAAVAMAVLGERDLVVAALAVLDGVVVAAKDGVDAAGDDAAAYALFETAIAALA